MNKAPIHKAPRPDTVFIGLPFLREVPQSGGGLLSKSNPLFIKEKMQ